MTVKLLEMLRGLAITNTILLTCSAEEMPATRSFRLYGKALSKMIIREINFSEITLWVQFVKILRLENFSVYGMYQFF